MNTEILLMYQCNAFSNHWYDTRSISIAQTLVSSSAPKMKSLLHRYLIRLQHSTNLVTLARLSLIGSWVVPVHLFYCKQLPVSYQLIVRLLRRYKKHAAIELIEGLFQQQKLPSPPAGTSAISFYTRNF